MTKHDSQTMIENIQFATFTSQDKNLESYTIRAVHQNLLRFHEYVFSICICTSVRICIYVHVHVYVGQLKLQSTCIIYIRMFFYMEIFTNIDIDMNVFMYM